MHDAERRPKTKTTEIPGEKTITALSFYDASSQSSILMRTKRPDPQDVVGP